MAALTTSVTVVDKSENLVQGTANYTITMQVSDGGDSGTFIFNTTDSSVFTNLLVGQTYTVTLT